MVYKISQSAPQVDRARKSRTELAAGWPPTAANAREAGHEPQTPVQAIRKKCRTDFG